MVDLDPIADVLRAHDAGLVLVEGSLECSGHVLLPWFAHAALRGAGVGGGRSDTAATPAALVVLAAVHPPSAHAAALRKVQQQQQQQQYTQQQGAPIPVIYVEPRFPGPENEDDGDEGEGEESGGQQGGGGGGRWLGRLSRDLAAAVGQQAEAVGAAASEAAAAGGRGRQPDPPAQITVLVDSLTALAAAADAGCAADGRDAAPPAAAAVCAPRPPRAHLDWLAFLHGLASLEARAPLARVRVVALCADDVPADAGWRRGLRHRASALLLLAPVEGRTAGLDGELRAEARAAPAAGAGARDARAGGALFAPGAAAAAAAAGGRGGWHGGGGGNGGGWAAAAAADGWGAGRCFFRASELSLRWVSEVQSADLMR